MPVVEGPEKVCVRMKNQIENLEKKLSSIWILEVCEYVNAWEAKRIEMKAIEKEETMATMREGIKAMNKFQTKQTERRKLLIFLEEYSIELWEDKGKRNRYINKLTWYIRYERGVLSKLMDEAKYYSGDSLIEVKLKIRLMKERYYALHNEVHET